LLLPSPAVKRHRTRGCDSLPARRSHRPGGLRRGVWTAGRTAGKSGSPGPVARRLPTRLSAPPAPSRR